MEIFYLADNGIILFIILKIIIFLKGSSDIR
jgi:hypothetical protein